MAQANGSNPAASETTPLAPDAGTCIASHRIAVDGLLVDRMRREIPKAPGDSGWRFLAENEDTACLDDPDRCGEYPLNLVANRDPRVIPLLPSPVGTAFRRNPRTGGLVQADDWEAPLSS